jgi:inosine-uridine nucleoside N-ribohydrolase
MKMNKKISRGCALALLGCVSMFFFALFCSAPCHADEQKASKPTAAIPVIFDTDIGDDIDDTWALMMLLKSPQFDVKLITTTFGKAEYRGKLIAKMLTAVNRTDIPIGLGEGGRDGTANQQEWVKDYKLSDFPGKIYEDGVQAVIDTIQNSQQPITIISVGPCNTMAAVVDRQPDIVKKASFFGMDGSVYKGYNGGKVSPEWNVKANVAAARKVLSAPWNDITITPLDTCGLVILSGERFATLKKSQDPFARTLLENYRIWAGKASLDQLDRSSVLYDTVAVYLANPGEKPLLTFETLSIAVTNDGFTKIDEAGRKMSVATAWKNLDGYEDLLVKILTTKMD